MTTPEQAKLVASALAKGRQFEHETHCGWHQGGVCMCKQFVRLSRQEHMALWNRIDELEAELSVRAKES
jgi:hypothetical protein